jgi:glyoxylase-like metal-dependent hydrolase (beta-lactamase superfamily II)
VPALRIAERWFEHERIDATLTRLTEPFVHPFFRCNIWHLRGRDRDLLIDTGLGVAPLREGLGALLDKPLAAVATHIHYDHVGGLHEFDERVMHRLEAPRMPHYDEFATLARHELPQEFLELMRNAGAPLDDDFLITARPADFDPTAYRVRGTQPTRVVDAGDSIDTGDRHFEVLHLPGHSPGSIGLWDAASGTLFSGDAIYDGELLDNLPDSDIDDYLRTMKRLLELPVNVVHGGHEPSFERARLREIATAYLDRYDG